MNNIVTVIGQRIRNYRNSIGISQETLGERAGLHTSYIGQLERGEKNATLETLYKVSTALEIPLSKLFEKLEGETDEGRNIPLECYEFIASKSKGEQELLYKMLVEMDRYKNK